MELIETKNVGIINLANRKLGSQRDKNEPQYIEDTTHKKCVNSCVCKVRWTYGYSEIVKKSDKTVAGKIFNPIEMYPFGTRAINLADSEFRSIYFKQIPFMKYTYKIVIKWDNQSIIKIGYKDDHISYIIVKNNNYEGLKDPSSDYELESNKIAAYKYVNEHGETSLIIDNSGYISTIVAIHFST